MSSWIIHEFTLALSASEGNPLAATRLRFGLVFRTLRQKSQATQARYSVPLVLGMPRKRGSVSTASRNARAVALKIASAM